MNFSGTELRRLYLSLPAHRRKWEELLALSGLTPEQKPDFAVALFDADDNIIGTASLAADVIKYVAIHPEHRGEAVANTLISVIIAQAGEQGVQTLTIFTKPEYSPLFTSLSFREIATSPAAVMLENTSGELTRCLDYLKRERQLAAPEAKSVGVIVMNANPLTLGHLHLIKQSAAKVDHLFIIPLAENPSNLFSYDSRCRALSAALAHLPNATLLRGSRYCISGITFPSYFLKQIEQRTDTHILLDLDLFGRHVAPALGATVRFVGSEPTDPLTARYNELMAATLPAGFGIEVVEIPRLTDATQQPISASAVRRHLLGGTLGSALRNLPAASLPAVMAKAATLALQAELDLTPKPGLVDTEGCGAHTDMDHALMSRSIAALEPVFADIVRASLSATLPAQPTLSRIGLEGEKSMLEATGGVNTHRGALFALGLTLSAATHLIYIDKPLTPASLSATIAEIAATFPRPEGTHGASVTKKFAIPTALDMARAGYADMFSRWMQEPDLYRRLLLIMSELPDSNLYHRGGVEGREFVSSEALRLLSATEYTDLLRELRALDSECIKRNLSPGGCADMLALSILCSSLTN